MSYSVPNWQNSPSTATPLSAANLNTLSNAITDLDSRVTGTRTGFVVAANDSPTPWKAGANYVCDGTADDVEIQAAIDLAQTYVTSNTYGAPAVYLLPGKYHLSSAITAKSAPIIGQSLANVGTTIVWDGSNGTTVITKSATYAGYSSFWNLSGLYFTPGTGTPGVYVDLSAALVDEQCRLNNLQFNGGSAECIKIGEWVNAHFRDLRFDTWGTYAITLTVQSGHNLSTFSLDGFTADNGSSTTSKAFMKVDNTINAADLGTMRIANGRIEINTALVSPPRAIVELDLPASSPNPTVLGLTFDNVTYQDVVGMASDCLLYTNNVSNVSLNLVNFRQQGLANILQGVQFGHPTPPVQESYGFLAVGQNNGPTATFDELNLIPYDGGGIAMKLRPGTEANDRLQIGWSGVFSFGDGTNALDTTLYRGGANVLKTDDRFVATQGFVTSSVALTDATTITLDASLGNYFRVTLAGSRTLAAPTNPTDGQVIVIEFIQDGTGSRVITYNSIYTFGTTIANGTLTTTASKRDFIQFMYNSTANKWYCTNFVKGY